MKSGILYGDRGVGQIKVARLRVTLGLISSFLKRSGKWLIILGILGVGIVVWPVISAEMKFAFGQTRVGKGWVRLVNTRVELVSEQGPGEQRVKELPTWTVPDEKYSVYIPKIGAKSRVIPNVDPGDRTEYNWALKLGVAEAAGLSHPGEIGTTYLFAHSVGTRIDFARYNAVFYLLHKLEKGDDVEIYYQGELYKYKVYEKDVVGASDLKYFSEQKLEEKLILQTCYPPGTSWKRLVVVAGRIF